MLLSAILPARLESSSRGVDGTVGSRLSLCRPVGNSGKAQSICSNLITGIRRIIDFSFQMHLWVFAAGGRARILPWLVQCGGRLR